MELNNIERERLIGILGRMIGNGVNPNSTSELVIHDRQDLEAVLDMFNKLVELRGKKTEDSA